jgi:hypothetical protein
MTEKKYAKHRWMNMFGHLDLMALYSSWLRELRHSDIPYLLIDARDDKYHLIEDENVALRIVHGIGDSDSERAENSPVLEPVRHLVTRRQGWVGRR